MRYTIPFAELQLEDIKYGGGKATSLAFMLQKGIPVPPGFVVTTDAFADLHDNELSDAFRNEVLDRFKELGFRHVAVRSSAIAEDGGDASWAGQLESYLNVTEEGLFESIRQCWLSVQSSHARDYAKDKHVSDEDMRVAVVVQGMVQSQVSGVMFTADPVSRDRNRMLIEGVYGLGEMIVQGIVTPDSYVVSKEPFGVIDFSIQIKNRQMVFLNGTNQVVSVDENRADKAVLTESEVEELARIGMCIEDMYHYPQDIEWAREEGKFYIVQARRITTL